jgi:branched-chain amino acid transport system permease protein
MLFIIVVLFAPYGLAGIVDRHLPVIRARLLHRLLPSYLAAGAAAAVLVLGVVMLVEMNYHLTMNAAEGPIVKVLGMALNTRSAFAWVAALAVAGIGLLALRRTWPHVSGTWNEIDARLQVRRA